MNKIYTSILLLFCININAQEEFVNLFIDIDSTEQTMPHNYISRVLTLIKYEYNHSSIKKDDKNKDVIITLKTTEQKKLKIIYIDSKNSHLEDTINKWLTKVPPIPVDNFKDLPTKFNFVSLKFVLETINYNGLSFEELIELKSSKIEKNNSLDEVDIYPSFGKKKEKYSDKEKASKNLSKFISGFIVKEFKYPDFAVKNNIQGKTIISFIINKEGDVKTIFAYCSHPILQLEGIDLINKFPNFNPAFKNGKPVNVSYALPLNFTLSK